MLKMPSSGPAAVIKTSMHRKHVTTRRLPCYRDEVVQHTGYDIRGSDSAVLTSWTGHVTVFGERISGLIDIGPTVSCLALGFARKILNESRYKWEILRRTADGTRHSIEGRVSGDITFRNRTKPMSLLLVLSYKFGTLNLFNRK